MGSPISRPVPTILDRSALILRSAAGALKPNDLLGIANTRVDLFGEPLHALMRDAATHLAQMTQVGDNLPSPQNRLTQTSEKDRYGLPIATLAHAFGEDDLKAWDAASAEGAAVFNAVGAIETWAGGRSGMHIVGGTHMRADPATSIVNGYGQSHEVENLFLAGPGTCPTAGVVNPTFTVHVLALRQAEYIAKEF